MHIKHINIFTKIILFTVFNNKFYMLQILKVGYSMIRLTNILFYTYICIGFLSYMSIPYLNLFYNGKLIVFIILFSMFIILNPKINKKLNINKVIILLLILWLLFMFCSIFVNFKGYNGIFYAFSLIMVISFSILLYPKFSNNNFYSFVASITKIWFIILTFSLAYSLLGFTTFKYIDPVSLRIRYTFGFSNANYLGMFSFLGAMLSGILFYFYKKKLYLALFLISFVLIVLSDSRTALYSVISAMLIFLSFRVIRRPSIQIFLTLSLFVIIITISNLNIFPYHTIDKILSNRLTNWVNLFNSMNFIELIVGKGPGIKAEDIIAGTTFDNSFLSLFVQTGILGFITLLIILALIFIKLTWINDPMMKKIAISIFLTWLLYSFFESSLISISNPISVIIWVIIGIASTSAQSYSPSQ